MAFPQHNSLKKKKREKQTASQCLNMSLMSRIIRIKKDFLSLYDYAVGIARRGSIDRWRCSNGAAQRFHHYFVLTWGYMEFFNFCLKILQQLLLGYEPLVLHCPREK